VIAKPHLGEPSDVSRRVAESPETRRLTSLGSPRVKRSDQIPQTSFLWTVGAGVILRRMSDVTRILSAIEQGDPHAAEQLLPLLYDELRQLAAQKLAHEAPGQTLQATALVHEAYVRLVDKAGDKSAAGPHWDSRRHFFAAAAEAMRRVLIDRARDKGRIKRGGAWKRLPLEHIDVSLTEPPEDLLALDEALQKLSEEEPLCAELVKLRFFAGLTLDEAARTLGIARRSADRYWAFARSWLYDELRGGDENADT